MRGSWEYYILDTNHDDLDLLEKQINDLGQKGWHLIQIIDDDNAIIFERQCDGIRSYTGRLKHSSDPNMDDEIPVSKH